MNRCPQSSRGSQCMSNAGHPGTHTFATSSDTEASHPFHRVAECRWCSPAQKCVACGHHGTAHGQTGAGCGWAPRVGATVCTCQGFQDPPASPLPEGRADGREMLVAIASAFEDAASEFDDADADEKEQWVYQWLTERSDYFYRLAAAAPVVAVPEAAEAFEVFDGPPSEAFGGIDPESRAKYERTLDQIEEAERR